MGALFLQARSLTGLLFSFLSSRVSDSLTRHHCIFGSASSRSLTLLSGEKA